MSNNALLRGVLMASGSVCSTTIVPRRIAATEANVQSNLVVERRLRFRIGFCQRVPQFRTDDAQDGADVAEYQCDSL